MYVLINESEDNPYSETAQGGTLATFNAAVLGQLLSYDKNYRVEPNLLEKAYYDIKNHEYILKLKKNIYFHNGRHANSKDLEFSLVRVSFTKYRSFYKIFLGNIAGIDKIERLNLTQFESGSVSGVKIVDNYTVRIKLSTQNPNFLYSLVNSYFSLVPKEAFEDNYIIWKKYPIGAGPYSVVSPGYQGNIVELKKYDLSLINAPNKIYFHTKRKKDIDYDISLTDIEDNLKKDYNIFISEASQLIYTIFFTNNNPLGASLEFRKFIQTALNRESMQKIIPATLQAYELLPKGYWGRDNLPNPYNPDLAKNLFNSLPKELREKEWNIPVFGGNQLTQDRKALAKEVKSQLACYGFKISLSPSTEKFLSKETAEKIPFEISSRIIDHVDPLIMFASLRKNSPDLYEKPLFDQKLEDLYNTTSKEQQKEARVKSIQNLSQYIIEKAYLIPLLERKALIYYNLSKIENLGKQEQALIFFASHINMKNKKR